MCYLENQTETEWGLKWETEEQMEKQAHMVQQRESGLSLQSAALLFVHRRPHNAALERWNTERPDGKCWSNSSLHDEPPAVQSWALDHFQTSWCLTGNSFGMKCTDQFNMQTLGFISPWTEDFIFPHCFWIIWALLPVSSFDLIQIFRSSNLWPFL